jgi:pyruvate dehydrogenase E2 component (dihydrolipoamide acetyltransferase)
VKEGDFLSPGDAIAEIETDKATMALECQDDLFVAKLLAIEGAEVIVGQPILVTVEDAKDIAAFASYKAIVTANPGSPPSTAAVHAPEKAITTSNVAQRFSPAARHMVESQHINTSAIVGTSRGGRISKADVINNLKSGAVVAGQAASKTAALPAPIAHKTAAFVDIVDPMSLPPVNDRYTDIPNTNMRKVIARRLTESKATVPHMYATIECHIDDLLELRKIFANDLNRNIRVNDLVIKAAALALRDLPDVRRKWNPATGSVTEPTPCDIAVAVATPTGLITPIVTGADQRGCADINKTVKELAGRAKIGKLKPEEYSGGCFSISNLGMFGINNFSAVINPPQACILAVGSGISRVMPPRDGETEPYSATFLSVQLSADRRVVDEALAARFLELFRGYIAYPKSILL